MTPARSLVFALAALLLVASSGFSQDTPQQQNAELDRKITALMKDAGKWQDVIDKAVRLYPTQDGKIEQISLGSDIRQAGFLYLQNHLDSIGQHPPTVTETIAKKKEAVQTLTDAIKKAEKFCKDHLIDPDF